MPKHIFCACVPRKKKQEKDRKMRPRHRASKQTGTETPVKRSSAHTSWSSSGASQTSRYLFRSPVCSGTICLRVHGDGTFQPAFQWASSRWSTAVCQQSCHLCSDSFNSPHVGHISWEINDKPRVIGRNSMGKRLALISRNRVHIHEILLGHQANEQTIRR